MHCTNAIKNIHKETNKFLWKNCGTDILSKICFYDLTLIWESHNTKLSNFLDFTSMETSQECEEFTNFQIWNYSLKEIPLFKKVLKVVLLTLFYYTMQLIMKYLHCRGE